MGKIQFLAINFANERQVYYPGEQLAGVVVLSLSAPMEARCIKMEFEGKGYCHWSETHGTGDDRRTEHYYGKEKIFEYKCVIYGQSGGGSRVVLPAGQTSYQFAFTVPNNIPSSFEGRIGHIRYEMKAEIDRPWKFDHKVKRPITINDIIDTNLPQYQIKPGGTEHKDVGCLCCAAGPLEMAANIDRACYCPGESIYITADIQNNTTRDMERVKGKLIQTIAYHASSKTKTHSNTVTRLEGPAIPRGQFAKWDNQQMPIPALPPSIINSRVITVSYYVEIEVEVPWGMDPDIKLPVTLGTIPFRPVYQQFTAPQYNAGAPPMGLAPPNIFTDMPPPSYASATGEQAVNIADDNDKHTRGNLSYMPVYTFAQPYQGPPPSAPAEHQLPPGFQPQLQPGPPGGFAPPPQQPGGYAPPPQQPGGYPPAGPPGGYPAGGPPPQGAPGNYPPGPPPQQPGYPPAGPGGYPTEQPIITQPGASPYPPAGQQPPYNPEGEAAPISKPPME